MSRRGVAEHHQAREYRLGFFVRWCEGEDNGGKPRLENLNQISGRDVYEFRNWRKEGINKVTLKTQLSDLRQFVQFCVKIDAVPESIPEKIDVPVLEHGDNERETFLDRETAEDILDYLDQYQYASFDHALFLLLWETGARAVFIASMSETSTGRRNASRSDTDQNKERG